MKWNYWAEPAESIESAESTELTETFSSYCVIQFCTFSLKMRRSVHAMRCVYNPVIYSVKSLRLCRQMLIVGPRALALTRGQKSIWPQNSRLVFVDILNSQSQFWAENWRYFKKSIWPQNFRLGFVDILNSQSQFSRSKAELQNLTRSDKGTCTWTCWGLAGHFWHLYNFIWVSSFVVQWIVTGKHKSWQSYFTTWNIIFAKSRFFKNHSRRS